MQEAFVLLVQNKSRYFLKLRESPKALDTAVYMKVYMQQIG